MQFIGKLMRDIDPAPIRARLDIITGAARESTVLQHRIERWRDRLLDDDEALGQFADEYPQADLQHLRSLIASVKKDRANARPPKKYRELFRAVRGMVDAAIRAGRNGAPPLVKSYGAYRSSPPSTFGSAIAWSVTAKLKNSSRGRRSSVTPPLSACVASPVR